MTIFEKNIQVKKLNYTAIIEKSEDGLYVGQIQEIPEAIAQGKTIDELIGDFCTLMPGVSISSGAVIGDRVTIGTGATIAQNVTIDDGAVIAAGAVIA